MYIPYQQIVEKLNFSDQEILLIASDVSKMTYTAIKNKERFNSLKFIESFENTINKGLILFPAFNSLLPKDGIFDKNECFPEMGTLSLSAFQKGNYFRNNDPLHSFLIFGKNAKTLSEKNISSTFGNGSIFHYLHQNNAKMLLIDVDLQHSFTFAHYVEQTMNVNYRKEKKVSYKIKLESNKLINQDINISFKNRGIYNTLNNLNDHFIDLEIMKVIEINNSIYRIIDLAKAFDFIKSEIQLNNGRLIHQFDLKMFLKSIVKTIIRK